MQLDINTGIGDHLIVRSFLDQLKDQYARIQITQSRAAVAHWRDNDPRFLQFIHQLGDIIFGHPPYQLVKQPIRFPFWPSERFIELGLIPTRPYVPGLIVNHHLTAEITQPYIVLTTKVREMPPETFRDFIDKSTPIFQHLAKRYAIVLLGEREVEKSKEYSIADNPTIIFSAYQAFHTLPNMIDLTIPALGITTPNIQRVQHDCYLMSKATAVITLGIGGNVWLSTATSPLTLCLRADGYKIPDLFDGAFPEFYLTRQVDNLCQKLEMLGNI